MQEKIRKEMQQLHYDVNCLSWNDFIDVAMRHLFVWNEFDKDLYNKYECPLNNWLSKWRNIFNLLCFECTKHSMPP